MTYRGSRGFNLGPIGFLIVMNLIFFIVTSIRPHFIDWLGFHPAIFLERPWVIITNMFVHSPFNIHYPLSSMWHILANMITLYFFGSYLTRLVGERNFWIVYLGGGILGNIFYAFILTPPVIAIGASGAIFALAGVLTVMRPKLRVFIFPIPAPIPLWIAVIGGFLILSFIPFVAWQAHLGGLVFGLIMGYFFKRGNRRFYVY
ncbi:rhomboid family intramembrane serine protease [Chloroflexota bacterium]